LKRQKKKGGKLLVDLVKLVEIAISPVLRKDLAEFEVAFYDPVADSEINGSSRILIGEHLGRRKEITCDSPQELSEPVRHFSRYIRRLPSRGRSHRAMSAR
jgi:hypothetical protein